MSLTEPLAVLIAGLGGSTIAGTFSVLLNRRKSRTAEPPQAAPVTPTPKQVEAALRKRVHELESVVAAQTERHVAFLEAQLEDRDRTNAQLNRTIAQLTGRGETT